MRRLLQYFWPHIRRHWKGVVATLFVFAVGVVFLRLFLPIIYKHIIDAIAAANDPALALGGVLALVGLYAALNVIAQSGYSAGNYLLSASQSFILKDLAYDAFERLERQSYRFFVNSFVGSLVAKVKRYLDAFEVLHDQFTISVWMNGLHLIFALAVLWYFSWQLGVVFLVWVFFFLLVSFFILKKKRKKDEAHAAAKSKTTGFLADVLGNILVVKMFAREEEEKRRFLHIITEEERKRRAAWFMHSHQLLFQGVATMFFQVGTLAFAVYLWGTGAISAGTVALAYLYMRDVSDLVWQYGRVLSRVVAAISDAKEMVEIFEKEPSVRDPDTPVPLQVHAGAIFFDHITFAHEGQPPLFQDFSLRIQPGEKVGLVGHSGSGKTTLVQLLLRFFDPQKGAVRIDGQDIKQARQADVRRHIAFVPQEPLLFHRSIKENIAYGNPQASMDEIIAAAKSAGAHAFIMQLPDGYETMVGERGVKLSGGQRQRIALARAFLKAAPIVVLDEATSALDSESEAVVQKALERLFAGKTALVIAHRLSTVKHLDRIIVLERGKIVEEGTHEALLAKGGVYARFWQRQTETILTE